MKAKVTIDQQIAALRKMTATRLRERYRELFGEESRSGNKQWLFRRCAWGLQVQVFGGLSKQARQRAKELARDVDIRLKPPADMPGHQPGAMVRQSVPGRIRRPLDARLPMPGTTLTRTYKGLLYEVEVLDNGFEYDGEVYQSLSAVAYAISGNHWNGFLFFGLKDPRKEVSCQNPK